MSPTACRELIWVTGTAAATRAHAEACLRAQHQQPVGWIGTPSSPWPSAWSVVPTGQGRQLLGRTLTAGVLDAHAGFDPDDFGALSGTISGGGALILLSPPAEAWPEQPDPALQPLLTHGLTLTDFQGHFLARLIRLLNDDPAVTHVDAARADRHPSALPPPSTAQPVTTHDQQTAIAAITALAEAPLPATLLITADRGRGKSAALGLAAQALCDPRVRLTGPSRAAVERVIAHAGSAAPRFTAPERVTADDGLLMVDEAAALPLGLLAQRVRENPRCVLTGTVHGYEGSGHGLTLRLARILEDAGCPLQRLHLTEPIRWPLNDPLEALTDRILLLSAEPQPTDSRTARATVTVEPMAAEALAGNETDLHDAFGLLVAGHYQTRPRDCRQLLDDPAMQIIIARAGRQIIGIAAARPEGGLDAALAEAVYLGKRRPAGHLIAQSLTFHAGIREAARQSGLRIQRIAVHPDWQRQRVGQALVDALANTASESGCDWLGTSFAASPALIDFWRACRLDVARVGNRRDPRSASHAVIMLRALSAAGTSLMTQARQRVAVHLPDQRQHALCDLPTPLVERLSRHLPPHPPTESVDQADLRAFAYGHRALLDSHGALARRAQGVDNGRSPLDDALLATAIRAPQDSAALASAAGVTGRREALARLRCIAQQLLESDP
ncbi:MAG: GNAT family N-acetyltransferase [Spiribacter sp.]|nr:GNAT family N-acetyltransferase [Spiribacter sp.]